MSATERERLEEALRLAEFEERGFVLLGALALLVVVFAAGAQDWTWVFGGVLVGATSMLLAFVVAFGADDLRRRVADLGDRG